MTESFSVQPFLQILRAAGAVLGLIAMAFGLVYAIRLFAAIFAALRAPEECQTLVNKWVTAVGGHELDIIISGTTYHSANLVAVVILGGGATILAWVSLGLILAGAKTVSWTLSDHEAIKKMLEHAFGPTRKPEPRKPSEGDAQ